MKRATLWGGEMTTNIFQCFMYLFALPAHLHPSYVCLIYLHQYIGQIYLYTLPAQLPSSYIFQIYLHQYICIHILIYIASQPAAFIGELCLSHMLLCLMTGEGRWVACTIFFVIFLGHDIMACIFSGSYFEVSKWSAGNWWSNF